MRISWLSAILPVISIIAREIATYQNATHATEADILHNLYSQAAQERLSYALLNALIPKRNSTVTDTLSKGDEPLCRPCIVDLSDDLQNN